MLYAIWVTWVLVCAMGSLFLLDLSFTLTLIQALTFVACVLVVTGVLIVATMRCYRKEKATEKSVLF